MTSISDLIAEYKANGIYRRELRPFRVIPSGPNAGRSVPNDERLSAPAAFQVRGGRGLTDYNQSVFGYFFGGGWVFGLVENESCRADPEGFDSYINGNTERVPFRIGAVGGSLGQTFEWAPPQSMQKPREKTYNRVIVLRDRFDAEIKLPANSKLRTLDTLAFSHDRSLRERDARGWIDPGYRSSAQYVADFKRANRVLKEGLDLFLDQAWNPLRLSWRAAKGQLARPDWEAFGSLIHYEYSLARFASWILGFADGEESLNFKSVALQRTYLAESHVQYSPPLDPLSERTKILERTPDGRKTMHGPSRDVVIATSVALEKYETIRAEMIHEFLIEDAD